ncbi:MAG TPA: helix-turn-helix domain-containing protein, partial [Candidatus Blautia gallistercoris]|nr:helix-turn-helix domain-containing protein [Candidatus Blautia gallistercoris]
KLRVKIEKDPQKPEYIKTVWGKGYRFETKSD